MFHLAPVSAMIFLALDNYRMDALIFILLSFWHLITEIVLVFCCSVLRLFSSSCFIIRFYSFDKLYLKNLPLLLPQPDSYFMHSNFSQIWPLLSSERSKKFLHFFFFFVFCDNDTGFNVLRCRADILQTFFLFLSFFGNLHLCVTGHIFWAKCTLD